MSQSQKNIVLVCSLLAAAVVAPLLLHAGRFHKTRSRTLNGIPRNDYQFGSRSASQQTVMARGLLLEGGLADRAREVLANQRAAARQLAAVNADQAALADGKKEETDSKSGRRGPAGGFDLVGVLDGVGSGVHLEDLPPPAGDEAASGDPTTAAASAAAEQALQQAKERLRLELLDELKKLEQLGPENNIRVFQMDRAQLLADHCVISDVAVQLHKEGCWVLSLRADQNPVLDLEEAERLTFKPRLHLKRNEFHINLRCYGFSAINTPRMLQAGRPMLADLQHVKFWVQRQEPRYLRLVCCDRRIAHFFDKIDRMEIEFYYR